MEQRERIALEQKNLHIGIHAWRNITFRRPGGK
jgi:hypothetical protein